MTQGNIDVERYFFEALKYFRYLEVNLEIDSFSVSDCLKCFSLTKPIWPFKSCLKIPILFNVDFFMINKRMRTSIE